MKVNLIKKYGMFEVKQNGNMDLVAFYNSYKDMFFNFKHMSANHKRKFIIINFLEVGDIEENKNIVETENGIKLYFEDEEVQYD